MTQNLYQAFRQWASRPADERFPNLDCLLEFTQQQKKSSLEEIRKLEGIRIGYTHDGELTMNGSGKLSYISNWAFGQVCRTIGAPASYLRTLPVEMTRNCLEYGLTHNTQESLVLTRQQNSNGNGSNHRSYVSAFTSPSYGRIWDADIVESLAEAVEGTSWHVPGSRESNKSSNSGLYASDHDMFAFLVSDDNPVEVGNAKLGRGFFCWNSETGASTFGLTTFLYNYVCQNHIVWGAEDVKELKIVHRSHAPHRFRESAMPYLNRYIENRSLDESIKQLADKAMNHTIGNSPDDVQDWFKNRAFTKKEIEGAWQAGIEQGEDVTTLWGIVQGLTAYSQTLGFADKRVHLDRRAGTLLQVPA